MGRRFRTNWTSLVLIFISKLELFSKRIIMPQEKKQRHDKLFFVAVLFMSGIYKNYKLQFHGRFVIKELVVYHLTKEILVN